MSTGWSHPDFHMSADGFHIDGQDSNSNAPSTNGIVLDARPTGDFTLSFLIKKESGNKGEPGKDANGAPTQNLADILYIGALNSSENGEDGNSYFRVIRNGGTDSYAAGGSTKRAWLTGYQGEPSEEEYVSTVSAFHDANQHCVTYVFKDGEVTTYLDGTGYLDITTTPPSLMDQTYKVSLPENPRIIFNGFEDEYNGAYLYIDDVFVYDTALDIMVS